MFMFIKSCCDRYRAKISSCCGKKNKIEVGDTIKNQFRSLNRDIRKYAKQKVCTYSFWVVVSAIASLAKKQKRAAFGDQKAFSTNWYVRLHAFLYVHLPDPTCPNFRASTSTDQQI